MGHLLNFVGADSISARVTSEYQLGGYGVRPYNTKEK